MPPSFTDDPDNPFLHAVAGQVLAGRQEYTAALAAYDRALALNPNLVPALAARARAARTLGQYSRALDDLNRAIDLANDDPVLYYHRAIVLQRTGDWAAALVDLDFAVALRPDDEDLLAAR